jgi:Protein of unknown function (DUF3631)
MTAKAASNTPPTIKMIQTRSGTEYRSRGPIIKKQVAALLKDFEIRPAVVHPTKRADLSRHGYRAAQFENAFARFLPPEPNIRTLKRGEKT